MNLNWVQSSKIELILPHYMWKALRLNDFFRTCKYFTISQLTFFQKGCFILVLRISDAQVLIPYLLEINYLKAYKIKRMGLVVFYNFSCKSHPCKRYPEIGRTFRLKIGRTFRIPLYNNACTEF